MLAKLITFLRKNYLQIIIAIVIVAVLDRMLIKKEFYQQLGGCIPYTMLGRSVPYMECKIYGHVVPSGDLKASPILMAKCKTGVPADTMRYKIIIDEMERYSETFRYQPMGHVVGSTIMFDNNKEYQVISTDNSIRM